MKTFTQKINESVGYIEPTVKNLILDKLYNAYREEIAAWYYYTSVSEFLCGPSRKDIVEFYEETAKDEFEDHAKWILERIAQLGGNPSFVTIFSALPSTTHQYINPIIVNENNISISTSLNDVKKMELDAIETYRELEEITRNIDVVTNRRIKAILADEEKHLQEIEDYICDVESMTSNNCPSCDYCDVPKCEEDPYNDFGVDDIQPNVDDSF